MSTSFLENGRYANPVLAFSVLGADPREVVRRAVLRGLVTPPPPVEAKMGRPPRPGTPSEREQAKRAYQLKYQREVRARRKAAGLSTATGLPLQRPAGKPSGLTRAEYFRRWRDARNAERRAAGLNVVTGQPLRLKKHPDLRGLTGAEYARRWNAKRSKMKGAQA